MLIKINIMYTHIIPYTQSFLRLWPWWYLSVYDDFPCSNEEGLRDTVHRNIGSYIYIQQVKTLDHLTTLVDIHR